MPQIPQDFLDFIQLLNKHNVNYLIVGGYAVATYGYVRYTGDIDFFIALNADNAIKMVNVFNDFGLDNSNLDKSLFLEPGNIIRIGSEPMRLEILNEIDGVKFSECYDHRLELDINGTTVNFIGLKELLKNKKATKRTKDKLDVEELEKRNQ